MKRFLLLFFFCFSTPFFYLGGVEDGCFAQSFSTKGQDFWLGFMQNYSGPTLSVYISSDVNTSGVVEIPLIGWSQAFTVTANTTTQVQVPTASAEVTTTEVVENKGIHVTANDPVNVYALNYEEYTSDAAVILPVPTLGIEYYAMAFNTNVLTGTIPSELLIVATENGTQVEITPSVNTMGGNIAGVPFTVTLNQGEVYQVKANPGDLTGTRIVAIGSCKRFAVFSGNICTDVWGCNYCDHLYEQMYPVTTWGKGYVAVPYLTRNGDVFRIMASQNNTSVTINGGAPFNLNAGQYNQQLLNNPSYIEADKPIIVAQYSRGQNCDGANADPFMILLSPVEQTLTNITFNAFTSSVITNYYLNVIAKTSDVNSVMLDGNPLAGFFNPVPFNPIYSFAQRTITQGNHTLISDSGVVAYVYGYGSYESYGYASGASLKNLAGFFITALNDTFDFNAIPNVELCPGTAIDFHGIADTSVTSWIWDFGDTTTATGQDVSHFYTDTGTYTVILTVLKPNSCGVDTITNSQTINIGYYLPYTVLYPNPAPICPGDTAVELSVSGPSGSTYLWSTGETTTNIFVSPPNDTIYIVTTDFYGCVKEDTVQVIFRAPGCNLLFVSPTGSGITASMANPTDLLSALSLAKCGAVIRMAIGTYTFSNPIVTIPNNVVIEGGFDPSLGWEKTSIAGATTIFRDANNLEGPPTAQRLVAIYLNGIYDFRLQDLTITTANAPPAALGDPGVSTYGIHLTNCFNYDIVRCRILPGDASAGSGGTQPPGTGGAGGGGTGSAGGAQSNGNGCSDWSSSGITGSPGNGGASGGVGGGAVQSGSCNFANCNASWSNGLVGSPGNPGTGTNGTSWAPGNKPASNLIAAPFYLPNGQSSSGGDGFGGGGGGSGSGGAIGTCCCCCFLCGCTGKGGPGDCLGSGNAQGGTGGLGGGGGLGSTGGYGGGGTFNVYSIFSGIGNFIDCSFGLGSFGFGGNGTNGQSGSSGSSGIGGSTYNGCGSDDATGGTGGTGGAGSAGGRGRDGADGVNGKIVAFGAPPTLIQGGIPLALATGINNPSDFNLGAQPEIKVENVTCTNTIIGFNASFSNAWGFDTGANPPTATGTNVTTEYNTTGFKDIVYGSDTYSGFVNIIIGDSAIAPVITTNTPLFNGEYHVCKGSYADFESLTQGFNYIYYWNFDGAMSPDTFSGSNYVTLDSLLFDSTGVFMITLQIETPCCGLSSATDTITLYVDSIPVADIFPDTTFSCYADSITLTASGNGSYLWNAGDTTASITVSPFDTTLYYVEVISQYGCIDTATAIINVNPPSFVYITGADQVCNGDSTVLTANGPSGATYQWWGDMTDTSQSITVSPTNTAIYFVTATLNGCVSDTDSMIVNITYLYASIIGDTIHCRGDTAYLTALEGSYFLWSTMDTTQTIAIFPDSNTIYWVSATWDTTISPTCSILLPDTITVMVFDNPIADAGTDTAFCIGSNITIGGTPTASGGDSSLYSYSWTPISGLDDSLSSNPVASPTGTTTYIVIVTDGNGCFDRDSITLNAFMAINSVIASSVSDVSCASVCDGEATVTVSGGTLPYIYLWSNGGATQTINNLCSGVYGVIVTDINGCADTSSVIINIDTIATAIVAAFSVNENVGETPLEVIFSDSSIGATSWEWDFSYDSATFNIESTLQNPTHEYTDSGSFLVMLIVTDVATGCTDTASLVITVTTKEEKELFIPEIFSPNNDLVNDIFYIRGKGINWILLRIYDRWGEMIFESTNINEGWDGRFRGKLMNSGVYVYQVEGVFFDGEEINKKGDITLVR